MLHHQSGLAKGAGLEVVITTDNWSGGAAAPAAAALVGEHLGQGPVTPQQLSALLPLPNRPS